MKGEPGCTAEERNEGSEGPELSSFVRKDKNLPRLKGNNAMETLEEMVCKNAWLLWFLLIILRAKVCVLSSTCPWDRKGAFPSGFGASQLSPLGRLLTIPSIPDQRVFTLERFPKHSNAEEFSCGLVFS